MTLIKAYGRMWARNPKNLQLVANLEGTGVYILYDGSLPVYVGMGNIYSRVSQARRSKHRGQMWDHFSWYLPCEPKFTREIEALLLKMLPIPLRILNRQKGGLPGRMKQKDFQPEVITRKMPKRKG